MVLKTMQDGRAVDVPIRAGEVLLIPPNMPHFATTAANTLGLVIERQRRPGELDGFQWYCEHLRSAPVRGFFPLNRYRNAVSAGIRALLREARPKRTCARCGKLMERS